MSHIGRTIRAVFRQKNFRHTVIESAARLFNLSPMDAESFANKSGLSLRYTEDFLEFFLPIFQLELSRSRLLQKDILEAACVSERMFEYIKKGLHPTKETLTAIAITLDLSTPIIQEILNKAGYALSRSLPNDVVVLWFLEHVEKQRGQRHTVGLINIVLAELGLPLLMTKMSDKKWFQKQKM